MRVVLFFVFCLTLNIIAAKADPISNCQDLTARIQSVKESNRPRKEKFSCVLNLLKSALADELENFIDANDQSTDISDKPNINEPTRTETRNEENEFDKLVLKIEHNECLNSTNRDIPTMIPIFKPKPVTNDRTMPENSQQIPKHETIQANQSPNPMHSAFIIPCQRAADVLDMTVTPRERNNINQQVKEIINDILILPREIICDERRDANVNQQPKDRDLVNNVPFRETNKQPIDINKQPQDIARGTTKEVKPQPNVNHGDNKFDSPKTLAVHSKDGDESVALLFKPKAITLEQLYGNFLKKLTITVLVPYHMAKLGQICEV